MDKFFLETLICGTEVICFRPKGDVLNLVDKSYYTNYQDIIDRLKNKLPSKEIFIPSYMDKNKIDLQLNLLIRKLLNE